MKCNRDVCSLCANMCKPVEWTDGKYCNFNQTFTVINHSGSVEVLDSLDAALAAWSHQILNFFKKQELKLRRSSWLAEKPVCGESTWTPPTWHPDSGTVRLTWRLHKLIISTLWTLAHHMTDDWSYHLFLGFADPQASCQRCGRAAVERQRCDGHQRRLQQTVNAPLPYGGVSIWSVFIRRGNDTLNQLFGSDLNLWGKWGLFFFFTEIVFPPVLMTWEQWEDHLTSLILYHLWKQVLKYLQTKHKIHLLCVSRWCFWTTWLYTWRKKLFS